MFPVIFGSTLLSLILCQCDKPVKTDILPPIPVSMVTPLSGLTTTLFSFDGSLSKPGNSQDKMYFRWDWNGDGQWDTKYSSEPVFTHRFYSPGKYLLILEVLNSSGVTDTCHISLDVKRGFSAPRAKFFIDPSTGNRLTQFVFDASLTKDDEDSLNQLLFRWDWDGNESWDTGFLSDYLVMHNYNDVGSYHPILEVKDPSGLISRYQTDLEVNQTNPRLYAHFTWSPAFPLQLDTVKLDAGTSRDLDHPENRLVYYWNINAEDWFGPYNDPVFTFRFLNEVNYSVTLRIVDPNGLENQVTREVRIFHLNRPPTPVLIASTQLGNLTTNFFFDARNTTDIEDLPSMLKVRWDFEADKQWDTEFQNDKTSFHRFNAPGVYKVVLEAIDTQGLTDTTSVFIKVSSGTNETGLVIDRRFDHTEYYPSIKIGDQWWMAKNMNYEPLRYTNKIDTLLTVCYDNDLENCTKMGGLYSAYYATLLDLDEGTQGICPNGWHIPTKSEWETLLASLNSNSTTDDLMIGGSSDFNAQFSGYARQKFIKMVNGKPQYEWIFTAMGSMTYFWSSTPLIGSEAISHWTTTLIRGNPQVSTGYSGNGNFYSVRCIKNYIVSK